jgi:hypothetical protein
MVSAPVRPSVVSPQMVSEPVVSSIPWCRRGPPVSEPVVSSIPWCRRGPPDRRGVRGARGPSWSVVVSVVSVVESNCLNLVFYKVCARSRGHVPLDYEWW